MQHVAATYDMEIARIELPATRGVRPIRQDDAILGQQGKCVGWVLSAAKVEEKQYALAYVRSRGGAGGNEGGRVLFGPQSEPG